MSNPNPSWSPVFQKEQDIQQVSHFTLNALQDNYPYYHDGRRYVKHEEIIAPEVFVAIKKPSYLVRQIKGSWWNGVEEAEEPSAKPKDTFLVRRDHVEFELCVHNPTEWEKRTLRYKRIFMREEMAYFRIIDLTIEYGTTYEGDQHWTRYTVVHLKDNRSPYSFYKDCRPEHHKNGYLSSIFSS